MVNGILESFFFIINSRRYHTAAFQYLAPEINILDTLDNDAEVCYQLPYYRTKNINKK